MEHNLTLNKRAAVTLTGIKKVKTAQPGVVSAFLDNGSIIISGANLSVQSLDIKSGNMEIAGTINAIKYSNQLSKSFSLRNIFK